VAPFDVLRAYLAARAVLTAQEFEVVGAAFTPLSLQSGEYLQRAGEVARHAVFVAQGCLRSYVIDADGKEHVVQFAPEEWWLADANSLRNQTPSQYFIDAIEASDVLLVDGPGHDALVERVPGYAAAFRVGLQRHIAAKDERIVRSLSATAEERYLDFLRMYPSIASRVPQRMLASYLGVSPETVSRIRKNRSRKS
jgi:CRP-like cAMP-binding protein